MKPTTILSIDTSCDETSAAVTENLSVLSNIVASQAELHSEYGGVVPHLAKREHQKLLLPTINQALKKAKKDWPDLDYLAVTIGPGLAPALEVGLALTKKLAQKHSLPLIPINHMEGHLLSSLVQNSKGNGSLPLEKLKLPFLGFLISGGHTELVLAKSLGNYTILGETLDDAAGEAFDKLAKMLSLGYPGGPIIEELAKKGKPTYKLPVPMLKRDDLHFSFSGLKASVSRLIQKESPLTKEKTINIAASFQKVAAKHLTNRLDKAITLHQPRQLLLGGGVISNLYLRKQIRTTTQKHNLPVYLPYTEKLLTDNAAMIGIAAQLKSLPADRHRLNLQPFPSPESLDRLPRLTF